MIKSTITAAVLSLAICGVAAAQTTTSPAGTTDNRSDCASNFKAADKNGDGNLDKGEIDAAKALIPTTMGARDMISMQDFMSSCNAVGNAKK